MFTKAVIATDFSPASERMTALLGGLLPLGVKSLVLFHAARDSAAGKGEDDGGLLDRLASRAANLREAGFDVTTRLEHGDPARAVNAVALEEHASLVVIGASRKSAAGGLILGSTVRDVIRLSILPVLLIKPMAGLSSERRHQRLATRDLSRHIVIGVDASPTAKTALSVLTNLATGLTGKITLVHCAGADGQSAEWLQNQRASLEAVTDGQVEAIFEESGDPAEAILKAATAPSVSLIVLGTHGKSAARAFFSGSQSQAVVRHAEVPVLLIPARPMMDSPERVAKAEGGSR